MGENSPMQIDAGREPQALQHLRPAGGGADARAHRERRRRAPRASTHPQLGRAPKFILGGGSNIVLTRDMPQVVLKVEVRGPAPRRGRAPTPGSSRPAPARTGTTSSTWTLEQGCPGLENLALIPGTVGAAPVQNIGAYGVELQDRFESLDAVDLVTGRSVTLDARRLRLRLPRQRVQARDSAGSAGQRVITRVRFRLPRPWQPVLGYLDLRAQDGRDRHRRARARARSSTGSARSAAPSCPTRRLIGNAGSFFKNPVVTPEQCRDIIGRDPEIVHYPMPDGSVKLAAGWMIDACGWKGKSVGQAGVYERQALVLVNRGGRHRLGEVMTLARAIQESVYGRFGIRLEPEPVVV